MSTTPKPISRPTSSHNGKAIEGKEPGTPRLSNAETKGPPAKQQLSEWQLDVDKLHSLGSEQQDLYLFNFVTSLEKHVASLQEQGLIEEQVSLKKESFKIITLRSPAPNRVVRNTVGKCLDHIFSRGNRKLLFETIKELVELITTRKGEKDIWTQHAAVHCIGEVYKAAGDGAVSLSNMTSTTLIKVYKASSNHVSIRSAVFKALGKMAGSVRQSLDESVARDIWKQSRNAASGDRGAIVQINACWCLEQLITSTPFFDNTSDFDTLKSLIWKVGDTQTAAVRHAAASLLAAAMVKNFTENPTPLSVRAAKPKKSKKTAKPSALQEDDEDELDISREVPTTPRKNPLVLELGLGDMLRQLSSQYTKAATTNRLRAMIVACYAKLFKGLEPRIVEGSFGLIADHLLVEMLNSPVIASHRYRLLLTRRFVHKLLTDTIGRQVLGESAQMSAARTLINDYIKNYPRALAEKPEPSKLTLTATLNALGSFIEALGSAFGSLADSCREGLIQVLQHPSYTVQIHASWCLRLFCIACPQQLIQCALICMNSVTRELSLLTSEKGAARKSLGYANGLSAVLSVSSHQPLYSSIEISSRVLKQATTLLKNSGNEELRISAIQIQVAWVLIGGLMSLGPNFVKIHLSQLLLLWRNALPKPLGRDNAAQRQSAELSFLVLVRECALGCILSFLEFNARLVTADVSKRIATVLQNTIEFLETLPSTKSDDDNASRITVSLQLPDLIQMTRRRVLQCFTQLAIRSPHTSKEILSDARIMSFAASCFAEPDNIPQSSLGASIANTSANFEGIWGLADGSGFGISGTVRGLWIKALPGEKDQEGEEAWHRQLEPANSIDSLLLSPICGAREHDSIYINCPPQTATAYEVLPDPPATEVVNAGITLFGMALPLQGAKVQESILEKLSTWMSAKSLQRDPGRRAAITVNIALSLLASLKASLGELPANKGDLKAAPVEKCLEDLLRILITDTDKYVRNIAYEAIGRLCNGAGNTLTNTVVNNLIETIVNNREPHARAGCAMALASIHANVGGMAAGFHLRKIHGVLMSLCSDPHPTVHFWAVEALSKVAESAGLTFSGYMPSTLGLLAQLWISDSHCIESDAIGASNSELELPTPAAIAHTIASLISVLGPDLQDMDKARDLILSLVEQFDMDDNAMVQSQALQCWEHIHLYAPAQVDLVKYVRQLQKGLDAAALGLRKTAINGLYTLMRKDVQHVLHEADEGLEEQLWKSLENPGDNRGVHGIIEVWLSQTALSRTGEWISRCQELLTKTVAKSSATAPAEPKQEQPSGPQLQDEEVAGFNVNDGKGDDDNDGPVGQELLRWQVRVFVLQCLHELFVSCARDAQAHRGSIPGRVLQAKVADIIRMAFLASTGSVVELRIGGLKLIDQILVVFGRTPDPDFAEALLLEQYQAQISSALTPAFGADSSPELAAAAINVCGTFIATGLVKDVDRMGRILKLLISCLKSFANDSNEATIGELKGLSSNAQKMIKMSVLSAWAELQVASSKETYLIEVVQPHVEELTPLWLSSLQDFAKLRFEPDISNTMGANPDDPLDTVYAALNRETLLKFYQDSWLILVDAIASLIDQDSNFVFDALDKKKGQGGEGSSSLEDINYRDEPVAFFFILYGIAFEALVTNPGSDSPNAKEQTLEILTALKNILRPSVSGHAIYQDIVFSETMELFDRLAQTEGLAIQAAIVRITRNLCLNHPSVSKEGNTEPDQISEDVEQLFELARIIVLVLAGVLPNLSGQPRSSAPLTNEATGLIILSISALVDAANVFPAVIRSDLHACILHIFTTILGTGACQAGVAPKILPLLKRFVQLIATPENRKSAAPLLRAALARARTILAKAQQRESEAALPCARNTLLAGVVLVTQGSSVLPPGDPLAERFCDDIVDCLPDRGLGANAANCARGLLLNDATYPAIPAPFAQHLARYLLPKIVRFVVDPDMRDPDSTRPILLQGLTQYTVARAPSSAPLPSEPATPATPATPAVPHEVKDEDFAPFAAAMSVVLPTLLVYAEREGSDAYAEVAERLLVIAGAGQAVFRAVAGRLGDDRRKLLETVVREGAGTGAGGPGARGRGGNLGGRDDEADAPTIELKMEFGG